MKRIMPSSMIITYNLPSISQVFRYDTGQDFWVHTHESFGMRVIAVRFVQLEYIRKNTNVGEASHRCTASA
jgi:hypothetical protein